MVDCRRLWRITVRVFWVAICAVLCYFTGETILVIAVSKLGGPICIPFLARYVGAEGEIIGGVARGTLVGYRERSIDALLGALDSPDWRRREGASWCFERIISKFKKNDLLVRLPEIRLALTRRLHDDTDLVRIRAALALSSQDVDLLSRQDVEQLLHVAMSCSESPVVHARYHACTLLGSLSSFPEARNRLLELRDDPEPIVRVHANGMLNPKPWIKRDQPP